MRIIFSELRNYENIALQQSFLLPPFLSVLKKKPTCLTLAWIETIWRLFIYHPTDKWKLRKILWYLSIFKLPGNPLECLLFMAYLIEGRYVLNVNVFDFYVRESYISGKSFMKFPVTYEVRTCDISDVQTPPTTVVKCIENIEINWFEPPNSQKLRVPGPWGFIY